MAGGGADIVAASAPSPERNLQSRCARMGTEVSASRNRLPTGVALRYVGVVARGIGAVVPGRRGAALTRVVIAIVGLVISSIRGPQWDNKSIPACPPPPAVPPPQASRDTIGRRGRHQSLRPGVRYEPLASSPQSQETISDDPIAGGRRCKGPVSRWDPLRRVGGRAIELRAAQTVT